MKELTKQKIKRNLIIFSIVAMGSGWLGVFLDSLVPSDRAQQTTGMGLWLVLPLFTVILLRWFAGDGWKDFGIKPYFKSSWLWYIVSIFVYPVIIGLLLIIGSLTYKITLTGNGIAAFMPLVMASFTANLVKNIFEEFSWRGYLTPRLNALGIHPLLNHLITGMVWASWHIPYWLFFINQSDFEQYTALSRLQYVMVGGIALIVCAVAYGELRLLSHSVWPLFLMHTIGNAIMLTLLMDGFVEIPRKWQAIFNPSTESVIVVALFILLGFMLYKIRMKKMKSHKII